MRHRSASRETQFVAKEINVDVEDPFTALRSIFPLAFGIAIMRNRFYPNLPDRSYEFRTHTESNSFATAKKVVK
jgi:hypothetical protein